MMFLRTVETAFARYVAKGEAAALAIVFDRTAPELLRLARHLAPDVHQAEDLVQATFLTAMQSPSSYEAGRPVLPWLCGILANHARSQRRQAKRKPEPSRLRQDDVKDVHSETLAGELRDEVRDAIAQLPEIYRPVLRLWLEHGLEAHEIATTLERPAGTVRAQVTRGMDQLRRILPAGLAGATAIAVGTGQGLAAVRLKVLAGCTGTSSGLGSTLVIGGLLMLHHKLTATIAALFLSLLAWFAWPAPETSPDIMAANKATGPEMATVATRNTAGERATTSNDNPREVAPTPAAVEQTPPPPPADTVVVIVLRDKATGEPLPNYSVALRSRNAVQEYFNLPDYQQTDSRGEVHFEHASPGETWVEVDRIGNVAVVDAQPNETTRREVELAATGAIVGTVRDPNGHPVAAASVLVMNNSVRPPTLTTTDLAGRFTIRHAKALTIQARHGSHSPSLATPVKATAGGETEVTLTLGKAGRAIRGVVRQHTGEAVPYASVAIMPTSARTLHPYDRDRAKQMALWLRTDGDGRFESTEIAADEYLVFAVPRERGLTPTSETVDTGSADGFVELQLLAPATVTGKLVDNDQPMAGVQVIVFPEQPVQDVGYLLNLTGMRTATTANDGTFRIIGVIPGKLSMRATRGIQVLTETRTELQPGDTFDWQPSLAANQKLKLQVRSEAKLPQSLFAMVYAGGNGTAPSMAPIDKNGKAMLDIAASQSLQIKLVVMKGGRNIICLASFDDVQLSAEELTFDLLPEQLPVGSIKGRLIDAALAPVAAATIAVMRMDKPALFIMHEVTTRTDGTFSLGPLPAGTYALREGPMTKATLLRTVTLSNAGDEDVGDVKKQ